MHHLDQDSDSEIDDSFPQYTKGVLPEAALMEMEFSYSLLPSAMRSKIVAQHLWSIRKTFPRMENIISYESWEVGELIITPNKRKIKNCIHLIEYSEYGPLENVQNAGYGSYIFKFQKPYNPVILSPIIANICGADVEPDYSYGDGNNVKINILNNVLSKYTFSEGKGDSLFGCSYKHFWQYSVAPMAPNDEEDQEEHEEFDVKLIREWERGKENML